MSQLYVNEPSSQVGVGDGRFVVAHTDGMKRSIPVESVEGITLFGPVSINTQCIRECLVRGIDIQFFSTTGSYFGKLNSTSHVNASRQRAQARIGEDDDFRITFSKRIIKAKIHNQIVILRRYSRTAKIDVGSEIHAMSIAENDLNGCEKLNELMGHEGIAARSYYSGLGKLVIPEFRFSGRSRRPPLDPFNSMLSLGYTILLYALYGAIESKGLNPYMGFMHSDREKHPTLASDMMEEWRAVIVDSVVMSMMNGHEIDNKNFYQEEELPGIFLDKIAFKAYISKLEKRFTTENRYLSYIDYSVSFRRAINLQIGELVKAIEARNADLYQPIIIR